MRESFRVKASHVLATDLLRGTLKCVIKMMSEIVYKYTWDMDKICCYRQKYQATKFLTF